MPTEDAMELRCKNRNLWGRTTAVAGAAEPIVIPADGSTVTVPDEVGMALLNCVTDWERGGVGAEPSPPSPSPAAEPSTALAPFPPPAPVAVSRSEGEQPAESDSTYERRPAKKVAKKITKRKVIRKKTED